MKLNKKDFIEIDFTAKFKETGVVFDSSLPKELRKLSPHAIAKPFVFSLGQDMFLKGVSDFLIGKEVESFPKEFNIELKPEEAFGPRESKLVQMIPMKVFRQHNVQPIPGVTLNFDGRVAKILSVSGGRILVDFNSPLAGKEVIYEIKVLSKVTDLNQKVKALNEFLFKKDFPFKVNDKKVVLEVDKKEIKPLIELFKNKFKEILNLDLEVKEPGEKTENKHEKPKSEQKAGNKPGQKPEKKPEQKKQEKQEKPENKGKTPQ